MGLLWLYLPFLCKPQGIWGDGFENVHTGYKKIFECLSGSLAKRSLCLGPASVINCTPLSVLSFWVGLLKRGCNSSSPRQRTAFTHRISFIFSSLWMCPSLPFVTLTSWKSQAFYRMSLSLGLSDIFFYIFLWPRNFSSKNLFYWHTPTPTKWGTYEALY